MRKVLIIQSLNYSHNRTQNVGWGNKVGFLGGSVYHKGDSACKGWAIYRKIIDTEVSSCKVYTSWETENIKVN